MSAENAEMLAIGAPSAEPSKACLSILNPYPARHFKWRMRDADTICRTGVRAYDKFTTSSRNSA
jgi:hypothetical protein